MFKGGYRMIVENPYTAPHYLTTYFPIKPKVIDKNRRDNGDYQVKPTQFWFVNCEPEQNVVFEPMEYTEKLTTEKQRKTDGKSRAIMRSMIHPQYARRFIMKYVLTKEDNTWI